MVGGNPGDESGNKSALRDTSWPSGGWVCGWPPCGGREGQHIPRGWACLPLGFPSTLLRPRLRGGTAAGQSC